MARWEFVKSIEALGQDWLIMTCHTCGLDKVDFIVLPPVAIEQKQHAADIIAYARDFCRKSARIIFSMNTYRIPLRKAFKTIHERPAPAIDGPRIANSSKWDTCTACLIRMYIVAYIYLCRTNFALESGYHTKMAFPDTTPRCK